MTFSGNPAQPQPDRPQGGFGSNLVPPQRFADAQGTGRRTTLAAWGAAMSGISGILALATLTVSWAEIFYGSVTLADLADSGTGGTVSSSASVAVLFYVLGGLSGLTFGIVGVAGRRQRKPITIAAIGALVSGAVISWATLAGLSVLDELGQDLNGGPITGGFAAMAAFLGGGLLLAARS